MRKSQESCVCSSPGPIRPPYPCSFEKAKTIATKRCRGATVESATNILMQGCNRFGKLYGRIPVLLRLVCPFYVFAFDSCPILLDRTHYSLSPLQNIFLIFDDFEARFCNSSTKRARIYAKHVMVLQPLSKRSSTFQKMKFNVNF
jgi:hypothetical protein